MSKQEFKKVIVEGIAMYPSVHTPRKAYTEGEPPVYTLDLVVDDETAKILTAEGLKPAKTIVDENTKKLKEYSDYAGKKVFIFKRKTVKKDGKSMSPLRVVDSELNPISQEVLIGNGSRVKVSINPFSGTYQGKTYTSHNLMGVQVLELKEYQKLDDGLAKTKGYVTKTQEVIAEDNDESPFGD